MKHLNRERWMRRSTLGNWQLKRVSAAMDAQFPRVYRELLRDQGALYTVARLRAENPDKPLSWAWEELKRMCNS